MPTELYSPWRSRAIRSRRLSSESGNDQAQQPDARIAVYKTLDEHKITKVHKTASLVLAAFGREKEEVMKYDAETGLIGVRGPVQNVSWLETDPVDLGGRVVYLTQKLLTQDGERFFEDVHSIREKTGGLPKQLYVIEASRFISEGKVQDPTQYTRPYGILEKIVLQLHRRGLVVDQESRSHIAYPAFDVLAA